jgi:hypothetical protein
MARSTRPAAVEGPGSPDSLSELPKVQHSAAKGLSSELRPALEHAVEVHER